ncbi:MAG TPA: GNAT family protein [Gemmatimonadales bacterium]|jgi:RimJ/RimL family protein N-acetyltransferase|nr:GNAT family protein [Gemmatimonadales bacterium]
MDIRPITLEGRHVRLEPLSLAHLNALAAVAIDPALWRWSQSHMASPEDLRRYVDAALALQREGQALPFAIVARGPGGGGGTPDRPVGSTRYGNIDRDNRRVEVGWTWVARPWQRTPVNTEAKYLLLRHAFETLSCVRVEFKTDALNEQSRRALVRIGAKEEGTFRRHMLTATGRWRDSVYYSILDDEWPDVKRRLEEKLGLVA